MNTIKAKRHEADEAKKALDLAERKHWSLVQDVHVLEEAAFKKKMILRVQEVLEAIHPNERYETWRDLSSHYACTECGPGPVAVEFSSVDVVKHSNGLIELLDDSTEPPHATYFCENNEEHTVRIPLLLDITPADLGDVLEADE